MDKTIKRVVLSGIEILKFSLADIIGEGKSETKLILLNSEMNLEIIFLL